MYYNLSIKSLQNNNNNIKNTTLFRSFGRCREKKTEKNVTGNDCEKEASSEISGLNLSLALGVVIFLIEVFFAKTHPFKKWPTFPIA